MSSLELCIPLNYCKCTVKIWINHKTRPFTQLFSQPSGATNENIVQNHLNIALVRKTTSSVEIFIWTELKTLQRMNCTRHCARRWPHHVIRSQSSQSKQMSFPTWPDLAVGFPNKRSGWEISGEEFVVKRALQQITALQHSLLCGLKRMTDMLTKSELYCTYEAWTALRK